MLKNKTFLFLLLILVCGLLFVPFFFTKFEKKYKSYQKKTLKAKWILEIEDFENFTEISKKINHLNQSQAINYLNADKYFWQEKTEIVSVDEHLKSELDMLVFSWNDYLLKVVKQNIFQIYFVKNMQSTAKITQLNPQLFAIFINENILQKTPNEWFNEKEKSIINFNNSNFFIKHIIADENNNNSIKLLEIILIHELGHCIGILNNITPDLEGHFNDNTHLDFFKDEFEINDLSFKKKNKNIPQLKYYSQQKIDIEAYIDLLKLLPSTTFPSVYSTVNYLEYFAEYFFTYVHCVEHKLPYKYQIFQNDELMLTLENGIHLSSNKKKKDFVKAILKQ